MVSRRCRGLGRALLCGCTGDGEDAIRKADRRRCVGGHSEHRAGQFARNTVASREPVGELLDGHFGCDGVTADRLADVGWRCCQTNAPPYALAVIIGATLNPQPEALVRDLIGAQKTDSY